MVVGIWMAGAALVAYEWRWQPATLALLKGEGASYAGRAVAFSLLALSPLFHAASCRSPTTSIFKLVPLVSRPLLVAVGLSAAVHLVVFIPALQPVFRTFTMSLQEWALLLALSASIVPVVEVLKLLQRRSLLGADLAPSTRRSLT